MDNHYNFRYRWSRRYHRHCFSVSIRNYHDVRYGSWFCSSSRSNSKSNCKSKRLAICEPYPTSLIFFQLGGGKVRKSLTVSIKISSLRKENVNIIKVIWWIGIALLFLYLIKHERKHK